MRTGKRNTRRPLIILAFSAFVILALTMTAAGYLVWRLTQQDRKASLQATATSEAERFLTETYGREVQATIENFESGWLSLETHKNPGIESELATGPYLDYFGLARKGQAIYDEPSWLITKSATVTRVRVLEYSPERFKAVAHVIAMIDEITPKGEFKQSLPPNRSCGLYVFAREDGKWKLAAYFNATDLRYVDRDWREAPDWLRQIIGDLPSEAVSGCADYAPK